MTGIDFTKYKTDEERIALLDEMELAHYDDWVYVPQEWVDEAKTESARQIIHDSLFRMSYKEEHDGCVAYKRGGWG